MTQPHGPPIYPTGPDTPGPVSHDVEEIEKELWRAIKELGGSMVPENDPDRPEPVDLHALMRSEPSGAEWTVEPVLPAGKLVAVVSKRGEGKSLLLLDLAANVACGQATLHQPEGPPRHVIYLDMEMGPDDLYDRLTDLGYTADHPRFELLANYLHYYLLPSLPPLDTEEGGEALEELVDRHDAALVIIDTVSRVVGGDENAAEPYRDLYRNTETRLKRRRVTLARLDHLGKDATRGSRGSSAKEDPMDVVWHFTVSAAGAIVLTLTKGRQAWIPRSVTIYRDEIENGLTRHRIHVDPEPVWLEPLIERIVALDLPRGTSANMIARTLRDTGKGAKRERVSTALRILTQRTKAVSQKTGNTLFDPNGNQTGNHPETPINIGDQFGKQEEQPFPGWVPSIRGNHQEADSEIAEITPFDDDFEPDPEDLPDPY